MVKDLTPRVPSGASAGDLQNAVGRAVRSLHSIQGGQLVPRHTLTSTYANLGELVVVDTTTGDVDVTVRNFESKDQGRFAGVLHLRGGGLCKIRSLGSTTINDGYTSVVVGAGSLEYIFAWQPGRLLMNHPTQVEDLRFPSTGIIPPGASTDPSRSAYTGLLYFAQPGQWMVAGVAPMPHGRLDDSDVYPHVHIHATTVDPAAGGADTVWRLRYNCVSPDGQYPGATTWDTTDTKVFTLPDNVSGNVVESIGMFDAVDGADLPAGALLYWELSRMGTALSDTYPDNCYLVEFGLYYTSSRLGRVI